MPARKRGSDSAFSVGDASVSIYNVGDFQVDLLEIFGDDGRRFFDADKTKVYFPSNSTLIDYQSVKIIVDPGDSAKVTALMPPAEVPPGPFVPLVEQLKNKGVDPNEITHVLVTHLHDDHFVGVTKMTGGRWVPSFPRATHLIPTRDWTMPEIVEARNKVDAPIQETLRIIEKAGLLQFVDGKKEVAPGIFLEPSHGESPGHQIVCVTSRGERGYCIGDLYHVKEEVEHPELMGTWADGKAVLESRKEFAGRASQERALIFSGHMEPGMISVEGDRARWSPFSMEAETQA